jgi:hypothetical protein
MATAPDDSWMENPIFAGRALIPHSTSSEQPNKPRPRPVPPGVGKVIGELGLRYRPANATDLEAHAERLRLLSLDLMDVPVSLLENAARQWVRENHFMPKASELLALCKGDVRERTAGTDHGLQQLQAHCDRLNAISEGRDGWHVTGQAPHRTIAKARETTKANA